MTKKMTRAQMAKEMNARALAIVDLTKKLSKAEFDLKFMTERRDQLEQDFAGVEPRLQAAVKRQTLHLQEKLTRAEQSEASIRASLEGVEPRIQKAIATHTAHHSRQIDALMAAVEAERQKVQAMNTHSRSLVAKLMLMEENWRDASSRLEQRERQIKALKRPKADAPVSQYAFQPVKIGASVPAHLL